MAQGNVRWVETVRQMGKACRKWETEEGNMFYPEQHAALERALQEHRLLWLSVPHTPGAAAAGTHAVTHSTHSPGRGPLRGDPTSGTDPPLQDPQLTPGTSARLQLCSKWSALLPEHSLTPEGSVTKPSG